MTSFLYTPYVSTDMNANGATESTCVEGVEGARRAALQGTASRGLNCQRSP